MLRSRAFSRPRIGYHPSAVAAPLRANKARAAAGMVAPRAPESPCPASASRRNVKPFRSSGNCFASPSQPSQSRLRRNQNRSLRRSGRRHRQRAFHPGVEAQGTAGPMAVGSLPAVSWQPPLAHSPAPATLAQALLREAEPCRYTRGWCPTPGAARGIQACAI
jgi:hypothetical protein